MYICQYVQGIKIIKVFLKLNTSWSTILFTINNVVFALEILKLVFRIQMIYLGHTCFPCQNVKQMIIIHFNTVLHVCLV